MTIEKNILCIKEKIKVACQKSKRNYDDVKLIAVSKTVNVERIKQSVDCGITLLGENKVQEITLKYPHIHGNVEWHLIGHLQTNKVKYIVDKVSMIQSVDSLKLVQEINKRFEKSGKIIDVLVEVNIGDEENKYGIAPHKVIEFLSTINTYKFINVCGLMTVAPAADDAEKVRPYFRRMKEIYENVKASNIENINFNYLSMGMTNDFEVAIEEGANIIRIGSGIFGNRNYNLLEDKTYEQ